MIPRNGTLKVTAPDAWVLPLAWCAVMTAIIAAGLGGPLEAGPAAAGFDYLFTAGGHDTTFVRSLAAYGVAASILGAAFMFIPKATSWRFRKSLAWATFTMMVIGGIMMLIVPQLLRWMVADNEGPVTATAAWSVAWMDAGARVSIAGGLVALATFADAWLHRA